MKRIAVLIFVTTLSAAVSYGGDAPFSSQETLSSQKEMPAPTSGNSEKQAQQTVDGKNTLLTLVSDNHDVDYDADHDGHIASINFGDDTSIGIEYKKNNAGDVEQVALKYDKAAVSLVVEQAKNPASHPPLALMVQQTPEQFSSFLSTLKKPSGHGKLSPPEKERFESLRQALTDLDKGQKKAFETYIQESGLYYKEMQTKLEPAPSGDAIKTAGSAPDLAVRNKIDGKVDQIISRSPKSNPSETAIRSSQQALFRQVLQPSQERLKIGLQESYLRFQKKITALIPGKIMIQVDGDITEILIHLSSQQ